MKQVCACSTLNLIFVNRKSRILTWHFQNTTFTYTIKIHFGGLLCNYKSVSCNAFRPHTSVFLVPWVKARFTYTFLLWCLQLISRQSQCSFGIPWNLIGGNPCWVTATLNPLIPVITQTICQMCDCSPISYFTVCSFLCTVYSCYYCWIGWWIILVDFVCLFVLFLKAAGK